MLRGLVKWNQDVCGDRQVPMSSPVLEKESLDLGGGDRPFCARYWGRLKVSD